MFLVELYTMGNCVYINIYAYMFLFVGGVYLE